MSKRYLSLYLSDDKFDILSFHSALIYLIILALFINNCNIFALSCDACLGLGFELLRSLHLGLARGSVF